MTTCAICKKQFEPKYRKGTKTCSLSCRVAYQRKFQSGENAGRYRGGPAKKKCVMCGKEFTCDKSAANSRKTCSRDCRNKLYTYIYVGEKAAGYKTGRTKNLGYVFILVRNHPHANRRLRSGSGYVAEHRLVMEKKLGRYLTPEETVHHINEIKTDNRIENLMLFPSKAAHRKHHQKLNAEKK